jgi:hypothetical protein
MDEQADKKYSQRHPHRNSPGAGRRLHNPEILDEYGFTGAIPGVGSSCTRAALATAAI